MTATIAYDLPVVNLIDELSATGHVTHTAYRKTSVTFHHNAGRLSHQGVLNVWKYRPASAHFDADRYGAIAQYVKPNEYAWACGNTEGNMRSISIEMANETLSPDWVVSETTWKAAARLGGWLFAKIIGAAPTRNNVFYHKHWYATSCAGPHMDEVYDQLLAEVQKWYNYFRAGGQGGTSAPTPTPVKKKVPGTSKYPISADGVWGPATTRLLQDLANTYEDGEISGQPAYVLRDNPGLSSASWKVGTGGSAWIKWMQRGLNRAIAAGDIKGVRALLRVDGILGPNTRRVLQLHLGLDFPPNDQQLDNPSNTIKALQRKANTGRIFTR